MLEVRDLSWPSGEARRPLFRGLSFSLAPGEALALTGPARSGKSILLRILAGSIRGYAGHVLFQGKELGDWSREFFEATGAVLDPPGLAPHLTALENLEYHARLYRGGSADAARAALDRAGLAAAGRTRAGDLGSDQRFLLALARAQLHRPVLLCVDLPSEGLSAEATGRLGETVRARQEESLATVLAARGGSRASGLCGRAVTMGAEGPGA